MISLPAGWATFPLFGFVDGRCQCGKSDCGKPAKHPMYTFSLLKQGEQIEGPPGCNYAVCTGSRSGVWVLDFDNLEAYQRIAAHLPPTFTVATGRGVHVYFRCPDFPVRCSQKELAPDVDVRGEGGYVVAPGSKHASGKTYEIVHDVPPAETPGWLLAWEGLQGHVRQASSVESVIEPLPPEHPEYAGRLARFVEHCKTAPPSIQGKGGSGALWQVALHGAVILELQRDDVRAVILDHFNARCDPPWSEAEIDHKLDGVCTGAVAAERQGLKGMRQWSDELSRRKKPATPCAVEPDLAPQHEIEIVASRMDSNVKDACTAIGDDPDVYQRAGRLVRLVRVSEAEADAAHVTGTPTIRQMTFATLKARLTKVAYWTRPKMIRVVHADGTSTSDWKKVETKPDEDIVAAVLDAGQWPTARVLTGIAETPVLRPDGSVLQVPGYDAATGYLYEPTQGSFPEVPEHPTHDDARRALAELLEVFEDFPYASEAARGVPVAALLSILARPAIRGSVPAFVFEAATRGSGKSLQADVISIIATGRDVAKATWPTSDEELDKLLNAYARQGAALFAFDNVSATLGFGGAPLDKVLTCNDTVEFRILGKTENERHQWRAVVLATGNNVSYRGDTTRRVLVSRLEPREEDPEKRTGFKHPDLRAWVRQERARLVVAALTLLRAYFAAGAPTPVRVKGSFEAWSRVVPSALVWAGAADPTGAAPPDDADEDKDALRDLLKAWPEGGKFTAKQLTAKVQTSSALDTGDAFTVALRDLVGEARSSKGVAGALRHHLGRVVDGRKLDNRGYEGHEKVITWQVIRSC